MAQSGIWSVDLTVMRRWHNLHARAHPYSWTVSFFVMTLWISSQILGEMFALENVVWVRIVLNSNIRFQKSTLFKMIFYFNISGSWWKSLVLEKMTKFQQFKIVDENLTIYLLKHVEIWWNLMRFNEIWWHLMKSDEICWNLLTFAEILLKFAEILLKFAEILMKFDEIWWN